MEEEGLKAELKLGEDSILLFKETSKLYFQAKNGVRHLLSIVAVQTPS